MQTRALETQNKILHSALILYTEKGYHNTTVDEIAKNAGVSTGIAYRYYKNKKDLLLHALEFAFAEMGKLFGNEEVNFTDENSVAGILDSFVKIHTDYHGIHEELETLRHCDSDVKNLYNKIEYTSINKIIKKVQELFPALDDVPERIYTVINLMEDYCHKVTDNFYSFLDKDTLKKITINSVKKVLSI